MAETPNAYMAVTFAGESATWAETGSNVAPGTIDPPPSILKDIGLYDSSGVAKSGVWSDVRGLTFGASLPYTGTKGSGVPEIGGRPDHENKASLTKTVDKVSPLLFETSNTGNRLEYLVIYHPGLNTVMKYEEVNVTSFNIDAAQTNYFSFHDIRQDAGVWTAEGTSTRYGEESIAQLWETMTFIYDVVILWVNGIEKGWDVDKSTVAS